MSSTSSDRLFNLLVHLLALLIHRSVLLNFPFDPLLLFLLLLVSMHCVDFELRLHLVGKLGRLPLARTSACFAQGPALELFFFTDFEHVHLFSLDVVCQLQLMVLSFLHLVFFLNQWKQQGQNGLHLLVASELTMGLHLILAEWTFLLAIKESSLRIN